MKSLVNLCGQKPEPSGACFNAGPLGARQRDDARRGERGCGSPGPTAAARRDRGSDPRLPRPDASTETFGGGGGHGRGATAPQTSPATNAFLYAFDAETGKELFKAELDSFNHFVNPVVAGGTVYATDWAGKLFGFGLKN